MGPRDEPTLFSVAQQAARASAPVRAPQPWPVRVRAVVQSGAFVKSVAAVAVLGAVGAGGYVAWPHRVELGDWAAVQIAKATGAVVQKIEVQGVQFTTREELDAALGLKRGQGLVTYDTTAARKRLEKLPWVAQAQVVRELPDTLKVDVTEKIPLARMEKDGELWVVDDHGAPVVDDVNTRFGYLPVLEGDGAPQQAAALFDLLRPWPNLITNLKQATWVGARRWDLQFASGVTVQLPADEKGYGPADALTRLAALEEARHVLTLPAGEVDLRLPDRMSLRLPEGVGATPVTTKPDTSGAVPAAVPAQEPTHGAAPKKTLTKTTKKRG